MEKKERKAELLLETMKGVAAPCRGASELEMHPELVVWVRRALRAGGGACLCEPLGPALGSLKSHVLAKVCILGKIMTVGH